MTDLYQQLLDLGFTPPQMGEGGDFVLQDDSDGSGPYIFEWRSDQPCPFPELVRPPKPVSFPSRSSWAY